MALADLLQELLGPDVPIAIEAYDGSRLGPADAPATLLMRTIVPLRILGIFGDICFIAYGVLANSLTSFFMYLLLLPINALRLHQMLKLVRKARSAAQGDLSMSWLEPYMTRRRYRKGEGERRADVGFAAHGHPAAVCGDDATHEREAEPVAVHLARHRVGTAIERLEDVRQIARCDAGAVVGHGDLHFLPRHAIDHATNAQASARVAAGFKRPASAEARRGNFANGRAATPS